MLAATLACLKRKNLRKTDVENATRPSKVLEKIVKSVKNLTLKEKYKVDKSPTLKD